MSAQTAGNTWMVHNAWKKGYNAWRKQRLDAQETLGSDIEGKWVDFKVKLDDSSALYLPTIASDNGAITPDEWVYSEVFWDDDGTEQSPTFHIIGSTDVTSSVGLVQEYHISRARQSANLPAVDADASDSVYAKLMPMQDELSDQLIDEIEGDGDAPRMIRTRWSAATLSLTCHSLSSGHLPILMLDFRGDWTLLLQSVDWSRLSAR